MAVRSAKTADFAYRLREYRKRQVIGHAEDSKKRRHIRLKARVKKRLSHVIGRKINRHKGQIVGNVPLELLHSLTLVSARIWVVKLKNMNIGIAVAEGKGIHARAADDVLAFPVLLRKFQQLILRESDTRQRYRRDIAIQLLNNPL